MLIKKWLCITGVVAGCYSSGDLQARPTVTAPPQTSARLIALITEHRAASANVPSEVLTVITPRWRWSGAVGSYDGGTKPITPEAQFRIASVTKPFTAAAILRLMEMDKLDIEAPISRYISATSIAALRRGGYDPDAITVQHLLAHTSGIYDYATDATFVARVLGDPSHQWTRSEQINLAMTAGKPLDAPG